MPPPFFIRYKRVVWQTFTIVFVLSVLVTLFTAPTYRAIAVVGLPAGSHWKNEYALLLSPKVQKSLPESHQSVEAAPPPHLWVQVASNKEFAGLYVEAGQPQYAADCANAWAETYTGLRSGSVLAQKADVPQTPFKPKKAQNVLFGAILGLIFGLVLAFFREIFGEIADAARRKKNRPAS